MKALLIGDVHLSDRPPSIRTESYAGDVLKKLQFAVDEAAARGADCIIQAGDMFHIKTPSRTSHELVQRTAEVLTSQGLPVLVVPGNHDMQHDRLDSLPKQPLGSLALCEGIELLVGWHEEFPVFGLPFLYEYERELALWMRRWAQWAEEKGYPLMVTHAPIFPPGESAIYEYIDADDWAAKMGRGHCYYGHIHDPHGAFASSDAAVVFCNQGALSRGSLHENTLKRKPAVTWYDSESGEVFMRVEVPHRPAEEVFRLALKEEVDAAQNRLDEFLSSVEATHLEGLSVEAVLEHVRGLELKRGTARVIEEVLEQALFGEKK